MHMKLVYKQNKESIVKIFTIRVLTFSIVYFPNFEIVLKPLSGKRCPLISAAPHILKFNKLLGRLLEEMQYIRNPIMEELFHVRENHYFFVGILILLFLLLTLYAVDQIIGDKTCNSFSNR